ncbi:MAG: cysteine methyltransferase [Firmicutes bacterium]|nr:cysteine methyltransferase [Bacillota bacterium]
MRSLFFYETEIGKIGIADNGKAITHLTFSDKKLPADGIVRETALIRDAAAQIQGYLAGRRKDFEFPLVMEGTPFQQKVWEALQEIPYGETRSYKEIAVSIRNPKACRAVGMANNKNPIAIVVPCHRVVGANGNLVGYAGGLDIKARLLNLEKEHV